MAALNRDTCISLTLRHEGGYTNHPSDPGGPTNWGITIHDARMYWKKDADAADVKAMPKSVAIDIYRKRYWDRMGCDNDPAGVDYATYDYGVNSGVGRAVPVRNRLKNADPVVWVKAICGERMAFLKRLRTWSVFGKGWGRRVTEVEAVGVKMALGAKGLAPAEVKRELTKEAKDAKAKSNKEGTKAGGAAGTPALPAGADGFPVEAWVVLGVIGLAVAGYFAYRWHVQRQRAKAYLAAAQEV